ncbi:UNVERIFIED_ORG: hypothetical protein M2414_002003 [Rahnella aquatilis]|nr:hypothetical protein [Rahnella sp. NRRL B-41462]
MTTIATIIATASSGSTCAPCSAIACKNNQMVNRRCIEVMEWFRCSG